MANAMTLHKGGQVAPHHLGDRENVAAIRQRIASMMQLPPNVPGEVVWAAAQLAVAHKLNPFIGEIYIMDVGSGQWRAHIGIKGLRTMARRQANFMTKFEVMSDEEVQQYRRKLYNSDDVGVRCTLWRLDVARECKDLGIPYIPVVAVGFWRHTGQNGKTDNIPNTWTAQQVAEKRAEIDAIKRAYDLTIDIADPAEFDDDAVVEEMGRELEHERRANAMTAKRDVEVDENGFIVIESQREPSEDDIDYVDEGGAHAVSDAYKEGHQEGERAATDDEPQPAKHELAILQTWKTVDDAKVWAVSVGACENIYAANNSFKKSVDEHGGRLNKDNIAAVYLHFLRHQFEKLGKPQPA